MNQAREFLADIAEQISMPEISLDIRRLIAKPDYQISDFVSLVKADTRLTVRLIRIANSELFGIPGRANNLVQAISIIGIMQLHDIMFSSLCMRTFSAMPEKILNQKSFWKYCIQCGIAARIIAQYCSVIGSNYFFTLGLLHEVGHAVMYIKAPEKCQKVIAECELQAHSIIELERMEFGFDYTQLSQELMDLWQLPEPYHQVAAFHLEPNKAAPKFQLEALIIHLAHIICQNQVVGQNQNRIAKLIEENHQLARLPEDIETIVLEEIAVHTEIVLDILWPYRSSLEPGNHLKVVQ